MRVTHPPFGTQYSEGFKTVRSTQRVVTQYAEIPEGCGNAARAPLTVADL